MAGKAGGAKASGDAKALGPEGGRGPAQARRTGRSAAGPGRDHASRHPATAAWGPNSTAVHAGEAVDPASGAVNVPIHLTTTFLYPELADGSKAPYIYTRYANPSIDAVEAKVKALEGPRAAQSVLFASGMAAIQAVCTSYAGAGDSILVQRGVYGGTTAYLDGELARAGVKVRSFDAHQAPKASAVPKGTRLVWMESITNPLLRVADLRAWSDAVHDAGAVLAVDATFASPLLQRPLELGADLVMHSATKYLGGHTDVTAGVVTATHGHSEGIWTRRRNLGAVLDPHAAYLVGRGMKTLGLRMERHCANARGLAEACLDMAGIKAVHYPGLDTHPDHDVAKRVLEGGSGGMLSLDLGTKGRAVAFRRNVQLVTSASSLGGVESLVSLPVETSHAYMTAEQRASLGISDGLVRLSVGIEDLDDLVADVEQAVRAGVRA